MLVLVFVLSFCFNLIVGTKDYLIEVENNASPGAQGEVQGDINRMLSGDDFISTLKKSDQLLYHGLPVGKKKAVHEILDKIRKLPETNTGDSIGNDYFDIKTILELGQAVIPILLPHFGGGGAAGGGGAGDGGAAAGGGGAGDREAAGGRGGRGGRAAGGGGAG